MRKWLIIISFIASSLVVEGQLAPLSDQYMFNTLAINPAYAGSRDAMSMVLFHRNQWTGFEGSPKTTSLGAHAPMRNDKVGLGLLAASNKIGITTTSVLNGNFAYRIPMRQGMLSLGLGGGLTINRNKWSDLTLVDQDDDLIPLNTPSYLLPNFSLGTYYYSEQLFVGFSIPMFLSHDFNPTSGDFELVNDYSQYNYLLNAGYLFKISESWKALPSFMIRYNPGSDLLLDLNASMIYMDRIQAGFSYRSNRSLVMLLLYQVNNQLGIAYTYDMGFGTTGGYMGGSHEIMIRYEFRYTIDVVNPRYF